MLGKLSDRTPTSLLDVIVTSFSAVLLLWFSSFVKSVQASKWYTSATCGFHCSANVKEADESPGKESVKFSVTGVLPFIL